MTDPKFLMDDLKKLLLLILHHSFTERWIELFSFGAYVSNEQ